MAAADVTRPAAPAPRVPAWDADGSLGAVRMTAVAFGGVLVLVTLAAIATRIGFAAGARRLLGFGFGGVSPTFGSAAEIFLNNAGLALVAFVACVLAHAVGAAGAPRRRAGLAIDALIAVAVLRSALVVGAGIGAYGSRMVRSVLPDGPVELLGYAQALALYVLVRRGQPARATIVRLIGGALAAFAVAALLETYVQL
ncbi:MAG TPA: hypothetical protein VN635_01205 [Conexibacter sp.]|nr:hypothetical protein [Conexibacter sp.]